MAAHTSITIRKLDPRLKQQLRQRAARHGRSMEEEAREILKAVLARQTRAAGNWVEALRRDVEAAGFIEELELPERDAIREPPFTDRR